MFKELAISIIIIILIFSLDILTQEYTKQSVEKITDMLSNLKEDITKENIEQLGTKIKEIDKYWTEIHDKLAYYIEHDELEKVDTAIVNMKSYIETKDFSSAKAELEECKFIIEHIQQKNAFNLQNIF